MHTCMHTCIHYIHAYITYMHAHTYIHTYITLHYTTLHYITLHYIHTYIYNIYIVSYKYPIRQHLVDYSDGWCISHHFTVLKMATDTPMERQLFTLPKTCKVTLQKGRIEAQRWWILTRNTCKMRKWSPNQPAKTPRGKSFQFVPCCLAARTTKYE